MGWQWLAGKQSETLRDELVKPYDEKEKEKEKERAVFACLVFAWPVWAFLARSGEIATARGTDTGPIIRRCFDAKWGCLAPPETSKAAAANNNDKLGDPLPSHKERQARHVLLFHAQPSTLHSSVL
ncbi:hypothetical protein PISL3812_03628 [Talaromyces islandicus]|uniref:Uncharacterized protein n=1 Tax=Talaromyces islandicus TaxID=28573 RepID=A0A0U1LT95_TALIS|nr:hypothetical protein PISL3812_03628 [Talaromyces islandicus]